MRQKKVPSNKVLTKKFSISLKTFCGQTEQKFAIYFSLFEKLIFVFKCHGKN
jgi:hypothetical protein